MMPQNANTFLLESLNFYMPIPLVGPFVDASLVLVAYVIVCALSQPRRDRSAGLGASDRRVGVYERR